MALVSMFLCNQPYASHGRDFLLGATILNFDDRWVLLPPANLTVPFDLGFGVWRLLFLYFHGSSSSVYVRLTDILALDIHNIFLLMLLMD